MSIELTYEELSGVYAAWRAAQEKRTGVLWFDFRRR
jgi:hypothetical protein